MKKNGFSLIEVMMVLAIMGVVAVGFMTFMRNQNKTQKSIISSGEVNILANEIRGYLAKDNVCAKSFKGFQVDKDKVVPIQKILKPNEEIMYQVGEKYGDAHVILDNMSLADYESDTKDGLSGRAKLRLRLVRSGDVFGGKQILRSINLDVLLDENKLLIDCFPAGMPRPVDNSAKLQELEQMQNAVMEMMKKAQEGDAPTDAGVEKSEEKAKDKTPKDEAPIPNLPSDFQISEEQMKQGLEMLKKVMEQMQDERIVP